MSQLSKELTLKLLAELRAMGLPIVLLPESMFSFDDDEDQESNDETFEESLIKRKTLNKAPSGLPEGFLQPVPS